MDRRKLLKALSAMSAASALSAFSRTASGFEKTAAVNAMLTSGPEKVTRKAAYRSGLPKIGVIAVGAMAGATLTRLSGKLPYVECSIAIDGDQEVLLNNVADWKILLGKREIGTKLQIAEAVSGLDIAFVVADVRDAIGTATSHLVAEVLRAQHVKSIGAPITPCNFERPHGHKDALACANTFTAKTDAVFPIEEALPSGTLLCQATTTFERLYKGITIPFAEPGLVSIDFEDISLLLSTPGNSAIGYGSACGSNAAELAAIQAITHPLLGTGCLCDVSAILVSIEGKPGLVKLREVSKIMNLIRDSAPEPNLIFGATANENMSDDFRVTIMTSGRLLEA